MFRRLIVFASLSVASLSGTAAQLSLDSKTSIPKELQQLIVVDYRAMRSSSTALELKNHVLPPELRQLEFALKVSGLKLEQDAEVLAFVSFRAGDKSMVNGTWTIGIAQGQFQTRALMLAFAKKKTKPLTIRNNNVYPLSEGSVLAVLNQTTLVFGERDAVLAALDTRDGLRPSILLNREFIDEMSLVDTRALWSLLDQKGTQAMMRNVLGDSAQLADYDLVKNRLMSSRYTLDFNNGINFKMTVVMSDKVTATAISTLMKGALLFRKSVGGPTEKSALDQTTVESSAVTLVVDYATSQSGFARLLDSSLFQQVVQ